ncbi:diacylglycerol kinase [Pokkaliibacter plantistimulans]|uniref:Diacylglycerol kinase n=1 Tax=Proteobacteria bacterium 228 TaxID=2083153 RepID=A0A2S5KJX5_9PROT|nr:diacylglycerol kinase [Pokkaliibacter plantistimulans]PPC75088.1 diacylglycerol kinase [Pokkaliibacter plantistimulans]
MKPQRQGMSRLIHASIYSWQGLKLAWQHEAAIRQECMALLVLIPVACLLHVTALERALLIVSVFAVLVVELLNSAIEAVVDRIGHEMHPLSGQAKDMGSAAVLVTLMAAVGVWLCILL